MDLDANCSTLGANGALAEIVAKHVPEAYIGPTAHAVPPNLSQISWILLLVVVQPRAKGLYEHFSVSERLVGLFCQPQTMESSVFLKENQWLALRSGQR